MARKLEGSAHLDASVDVVHAALVSEQHWRDRLARAGSVTAALESVSTGAGTIEVVMTETIGAQLLPSIIRRIRKGDLVIRRTESWRPLAGDQAEGSFTADVDGAPVHIEGTLTLRASGTGSVLELTGKAAAKIPLIGGAIEGIVGQNVLKLLSKDQAYLQEWIDSPK